MEAYEYSTMYHFETSYWWYRGLHGAMVDLLHALNLPPRARLLDAGCGTGGNLVSLRQAKYRDVFGFDYSPHATTFWDERGLTRACIASTNEIPYAANTFDAVMSVDVLEIDTVDEAKAIAELWRVTKPGGYMVLVVPAYKWMMTEEHHKAIHASRRYTRREVAALLTRHPARLLRVTHFFAALFPAVAVYRLGLQRFSRPSADAAPRSELKPLPAPINETLAAITRAERLALRAVDLPFGSSIIGVAQKAE
jgi:SAM-dependent methyltransferase